MTLSRKRPNLAALLLTRRRPANVSAVGGWFSGPFFMDSLTPKLGSFSDPHFGVRLFTFEGLTPETGVT